MIAKKVWTEIGEVPKERVKIGTRWVFDIKNTGRYRARLWVQGGTPKQVSFELAADAIAEAKASISGETELELTYEPTQSARD